MHVFHMQFISGRKEFEMGLLLTTAINLLIKKKFSLKLVYPDQNLHN